MSAISEAVNALNNPKVKSIAALEAELKDKVNAIQDYSDPKYISLLKELSRISDLKSKISQLEMEIKSYTEASEMQNQPDFEDMAKEQMKTSEENIQKLLFEISEYTRPSLPNDEKKAIFEIRPGVGGVEASLFAEDLFKMYIKYCNMNNIQTELYSLAYNTEGGINEAVFLVNEDGSFGKFRFEGGVHRVQRVPKTEALGRIHTSTASVVVIPQFDEKSIEINPNDLRIDVYRAGGPGGQSVNTTDSAVRITHIPTGIVVTCQNGKSQHKNKEMAMSVLYSKLQEIEANKRNQEEQKLRKESVQDADRSSKIRTYNFPQSRITDHRINESWFNIEEAMEGNLDEILSSTSKILRDRLAEKE